MSTGQLLFADVGAGPVIQSTRGATTVGQLESTYTVAFGTTNVSKCAYTASPQGAALSLGRRIAANFLVAMAVMMRPRP